jgi:hypothetical protein
MRPVVIRQSDGFFIARTPTLEGVLGRRTGTFALKGPGLDPDGIPFATMEQATARGRAIAQSSRVSLWDATQPGAPLSIVSFRRE